MFEQIMAYKNIRKAEKCLKGIRRFAELSHNEELLIDVNETIYKNRMALPIIVCSRKRSRAYNLSCIKNGWVKG